MNYQSFLSDTVLVSKEYKDLYLWSLEILIIFSLIGLVALTFVITQLLLPKKQGRIF